MTRDELQSRWLEVLREQGVGEEAAAAAFADLAARYGEPHRRYHTLDHIAQVLSALPTAGPGPTNPALLLAAWLHDVVYDPRAADNEEQSAAYARRLLSGFAVPLSVVDRTVELILLTKTHQAGADAEGQQLLDADLCVLGADAPAYDCYAASIREEYSWVPEAAYRSGRAKVLRGFLQRAWIFQTATFQERYESPARANLAREITRLEDG